MAEHSVQGVRVPVQGTSANCSLEGCTADKMGVPGTRAKISSPESS